jgi:hypothetical protein
MYRPSYENRTSEMDEMISEKKEREDGSSSCSKTVEIQLTLDQLRYSIAHTLRVLVTQRAFSHVC